MRIALDARTIYAPQRRGIGRTLVELYRHLAELRPDWRVTAYHRAGKDADADTLPAEFVQPRPIDTRGERLDAWTKFRLPLAVWMNGADVLHSPANHCPSWMPVPTVVTIHDLIPLDRATDHKPEQVERFRQSVRCACHRAAAITCPSKYTRDRLIAEHGAASERVTVLPWAPPEALTRGLVSGTRARELCERYGVSPRFVLHFGAAEPRKNTQRVLEAWAVVPQSVRRNRRLLIVGLDTWTRDKLKCSAKTLGVSSSVSLHGFADEADIPALLSLADALVYPSLSEGFGVPVLEAFAANTAVVTSDRTALPEVAGNAALLVHPEDTIAIAGAIKRLLSDAQLREQCVKRGHKRLKAFAWRQTAEQFAQILETAAEVQNKHRKAA